MLKKTLIALGLLATTTLSGCVVYSPPPPHYGYVYEPAPVVVAPVVPIFGFWGGGYWRGGGYYRGGGGHWR